MRLSFPACGRESMSLRFAARASAIRFQWRRTSSTGPELDARTRITLQAPASRAASTSAHGQGPRAANSADQAVGVGGRARKCQQDFSQIWPTPTRRAPGDTVSRELAGGLSHSLIRESHDQWRVEWAGQEPIQLSRTRTRRPWLGTQTLGCASAMMTVPPTTERVPVAQRGRDASRSRVIRD